jgi:DNA-binding NarL/FixJ family response regulator
MAKILIVDDNPIGRMLVAGVLQATRTPGMEILVASTAVEAAVILDRNSIDMLFTDLHMNDVTGLQLIVKLRKSGFTLPIVVVTMEESPEMLKKVLDAGATLVLSKRAKPAELQQALELVKKKG